MAVKVVCQNKKAYHDYHIEATYEAGMVLSGPEVKSLRAGKANMRDGYVQINGRGEAMMYNVHISFYTFATHNPNEPLRVRKLLLHQQGNPQTDRETQGEGACPDPLEDILYNNGKAKVELGLARGKKQYDKRAALKEKQSDREVQRAMRHDPK